MTSLVEIAKQLQFSPTNAQIRARNAYWEKGDVQVPPEPTLELVTAAAPSKQVSRCLERSWSIPGFQEWFLNPQWEQEEAQRLIHLGMQQVARLLINSEDDEVVLKAAKEARELHTRLGQAADSKRKYSDEAVQKMTPEELREFIRRNTANIS